MNRDKVDKTDPKDTKDVDFFNQLQENEKEKGKAIRGKGHAWTTFIETLLGDW